MYSSNKSKLKSTVFVTYKSKQSQVSPGGLQLGHPVLTQRFIVIDPTIVAKSSQSSNVEDHKNDEQDDVHH